MKNTLLIFMLVMSSFTLIAQNNKVDKRLLSKYSIEELNKIKSEDPKEFKFLNFCIENAFYIAEIPQEKIKANPTKFGEISIKNSSKINFYKLNVDLKENEYQSFVIKGTKKILIVKLSIIESR